MALNKQMRVCVLQLASPLINWKIKINIIYGEMSPLHSLQYAWTAWTYSRPVSVSIYELYVYHIFSVLINYLASEQLPYRIQFWDSLQQFNLLIRAKHPANTLIIRQIKIYLLIQLVNVRKPNRVLFKLRKLWIMIN